VGPSCGQVLGRGVSEAEKSEVVRLHNQLRAKVANGLEVSGLAGPQPPAADMLELVWDEEVCFCSQCVQEPNPTITSYNASATT
jgi:hypothetical protein